MNLNMVLWVFISYDYVYDFMVFFRKLMMFRAVFLAFLMKTVLTGHDSF